jgi:hypothetical protein
MGSIVNRKMRHEAGMGVFINDVTFFQFVVITFRKIATLLENGFVVSLSMGYP